MADHEEKHRENRKNFPRTTRQDFGLRWRLPVQVRFISTKSARRDSNSRGQKSLLDSWILPCCRCHQELNNGSQQKSPDHQQSKRNVKNQIWGFWRAELFCLLNCNPYQVHVPWWQNKWHIPFDRPACIPEFLPQELDFRTDEARRSWGVPCRQHRLPFQDCATQQEPRRGEIDPI